jgi:hypothetical protein
MLCVCAACHDGRTVRVPWTLSPANCMPHRHLPGSSRPSACPSIYLPLCRFGHCSVRCQYGPTVWVQCVGWSVRACARPPVRSLVRPHAQHIALIVPQQLHTQPNAHLVFLNTTRRISTFILINRLDTHRAKCYSCTALMLTDATMDPEHRSYANTHQRQPPAQRANAPTNPPLARSPHHGDAPGCCPLRVSLFDAKPHHVEPTLMPPASGGPPAWTVTSNPPATHQQPTSEYQRRYQQQFRTPTKQGVGRGVHGRSGWFCSHCKPQCSYRCSQPWQQPLQPPYLPPAPCTRPAITITVTVAVSVTGTVTVSITVSMCHT